ncbi:MAG: TetR/AcrR family transcriptional regulator [Anaerolineales bacterium]|nr:TetR/AcrR family transcriptional regulator [Anaerolineales bacterium]
MMTTDTREKILQAASRLFVRQGYTATSVQRIARETGIGKATIYHHFPDKQAIAYSLLDRSSSRVQDALSAANAGDDPRRRIEAIARAGIRLRNESFDLFQVIRREVPGSRTRVHAQLGSFFVLYTTGFTDAIRAGIRQGIFRPVEPTEAARALLIMLTGLYVQIYLSGNRFPDPEKTLRSMLDIFFRGMETR